MSVIEYFEALERLKANNPKILPKNTKITNDSVALEAGRSRGSIKKSRAVFSQLIEAIDMAAEEQRNISFDHVASLRAQKEKFAHLQKLYEKAINREIMLIKRIYELEADITKLTNDRVKAIHENLTS